MKQIMKEAKFSISNESDTQAFGKRLAALIQKGDVIGLSGDLGAGKTFLSHEICRALGVPESQPVNSPTFTIINEYHCDRFPVYHMDLYRLSEPDELYDLGLWEYYDGDGVCLVEWFDKFHDLWPEEALMLRIHLLEGEARLIEARGHGRGAEILEKL
ncbi:MAG: tRNA (adenosine(37)-N6)-threonylcarbamoyltransferase complex ATPase subunit type 1 TsaE [Deltaproteobacteria bacterium]|nr:tRNA (adenosine(37)-N6)-threonylcarbamoyltransferase complex ATPase subunit type 1 TsaE [Deltaproteobacteria bacterium]